MFVFTDAPRVTIEDDNKTVTAGDDVSLDCLIDANPMNLSLVEWYHNGHLINVENERFEGGTSEPVSLAINPIIPQDAGDYSCSAQNEVGQDVSVNSVNLEVLCE